MAKCGNENQAGEDQGVTPGRWLRKWQKGQCLPQMISQEDGGRGGIVRQAGPLTPATEHSGHTESPANPQSKS